jgi:antitoxin (DNA-binding transcriptional repressor) of toxin-antitoxin stability system
MNAARMSDATTPPAYTELVDRLGPPVGVEDARARWGELVRAAENGRTTLITRERWEWAALVPIAEVSPNGLPHLPLSRARSKLGDLVRMVALPSGTGEVLTRHRRPVAALISAQNVAGPPSPKRRLTAEHLLYDGHTITLRFDPAQDDLMAEPAFHAVVLDSQGGEVAAGTGASITETLLHLAPTADAETDRAHS